MNRQISSCLLQKACLLVPVSACLFPLVVQAQVDNIPQPVLPVPEPLPERETLPPLEEILPTPETTPTEPQLPTEGIPEVVTVEQFEVVGSTVFSQEQFAEILAPYTQRPISFAELLEAQQAVTQLYLDNGYITSGAFIPPQALADGVVKIEVIEGEVEAIEISGLRRLHTDYVGSRLAIATDTPLNQAKLLNALQLLQLDPLISNLAAELAAGSRPGSSRLEVEVEEASSFDVTLSIDNQRSPSVGTNRRQIQISQGNLLGFGDRFRVGYINTDGSNSLDNLSYTFPINPYNGTVSFSHSRTRSEIIEEPFDELDIDSKVIAYEFTYRQPLYQTPNQDFALGLSFTRQDAETTLLDTPFPLSRGADEDGKTKISALRFFQEYSTRNEQQVFALRSQFSFGIDVFGATNNEDLPDTNFFAWRGQAQYLRLLAPDTILLLRSDLQLATEALVPIEQFSLGGQLSVRGYRQDALLSDNGFFASAELRAPILRIPEWEATLQIAPFVDIGTVWNSDDVELEEGFLASVGVGLRLQISDYVGARLDWGIPLVDLDNDKDTLQENGVYFSIEFSPF